MRFSEIKVGQRAQRKLIISKEDMDSFHFLSKDNNTIHEGVDGIVFGMLIMSYISGFIGNQLPGDGSIWYDNKTTFLRPLYVDDEIIIKGVVVDKRDGNKVKLYIDVYREEEVCVSSSYLIKVPE